MTRRSRFADQQILHAIASGHAENPHRAKANLLVRMDVMYKLTIGQDIGKCDRLDQSCPLGSTTPPNRKEGTLCDLFIGTTASFRR